MLDKEFFTISAALHASFAKIKAWAGKCAVENPENEKSAAIREYVARICMQVVSMASENENDRKGIFERVFEIVEVDSNNGESEASAN